MAESSVNVTEGSGKRLHTNDRTISAVLVQDQVVIPGEFPYASYIASAANVSAAAAADHVMQLMAGSSLHLRIRRIRVEQYGLITAAAAQQLELWRLTSAGTGGTAVTAAKFNTADAAAGAAGMTLPSAKGTEGTRLDTREFFAVQTASTAGSLTPYIEWTWGENMGPLIVPAGTANGIAIKCLSARTGLTVSVAIEFVETSFV